MRRINMSYNISIVGAGMIGLALANALAQAGFQVQLVEAQQPDFDSQVQPQRVSAINLHARDLLQSLSAWSVLNQTKVTPFSKIEAWVHAKSERVHFNAADMGRRYLGYIIENNEITRVLWEMAEADKHIDICCPQQVDSISALEGLIIGADGGRSWLRKQAGFEVNERSYGQRAIVATIQTQKPHLNTAYQSFLKTGPLGVLPLHDPQQCSIVWSADDAEAERLIGLDELAFNRALANAFNVQLGKMTLLTKRLSFPLIMRHAKCYAKPGIVLVGDAAHTIHPLAGQGANLGFQDVKALAEVLITARQKGQDIAALPTLQKYTRARRWHNSMMQLAMLGFYMFKQPFGFNIFDKQKWLKRSLTQFIV